MAELFSKSQIGERVRRGRMVGAMSIARSLTLFALAALAEIGGAWLVWQGVREHRGVAFIGAGVAALGGYGFVATQQDDPNFGRILAAYGGIFVAGPLAWGVVVDGFRPTPSTQSKDLATEDPARLEALKGLWFYYAGIYNGLPLDDRTTLEQVLSPRPEAGPDRHQYTYFPDCGTVPEFAGVAVNGHSYTIAAGLGIDSADAAGVIYAHGGVCGGHSLYVKDQRLRYTYNWLGTYVQGIVADRALEPGAHVVSVDFTATGPSTDPNQPGTAGSLTLYIDDQAVGSATIVTQPGDFSPPVTGSVSDATTGRPRVPPTAHRSASPAGRSTKSSSTSPGNATSTTKPRCAAGSQATEPLSSPRTSGTARHERIRAPDPSALAASLRLQRPRRRSVRERHIPSRLTLP
jgi:drug/metabolite transporter superfamily protein YnfA